MSSRNDDPWRAAMMVSAIGVNLVVCLVGGFLLGSYVGKSTGHETLGLAVGAMGGLAIGVIIIIFLIKRFMGDPNG